MGKQVKNWTPPDDAVTETVTEPVWTPPADAVVEEPVKKKESPGLGGADFITQQRQQFKQEPKPSEKNTEKSTDTNDWKGIAEAAKAVSPLAGAVVDLTRKIASGFADELPQAIAQGLEVAKSSVNPASSKEFIERLPVDFQRYVREKEGLAWYEPFDQKKYIDKYADSFMEETGRADIAKNIAENSPEILERRKGVEKYVSQQKAEGAEKMAGATQSYKQIKNLTDFASYIGTLGGNAAYQIPLSVLTKGASSLLQESATVYDQQLDNIAAEKGISREQVIEQGLDSPAEGQAYAVLAAALDKASAGNIMKAFKSGGGQMVKKWISSAVPEAVTEPVQGILEDVGAGGNLSEALTSSKRIDELAGGIVGGSMGVLGPTSVVNQVRENLDVTDPQALDAAGENVEQALNQDQNAISITSSGPAVVQPAPGDSQAVAEGAPAAESEGVTGEGTDQSETQKIIDQQEVDQKSGSIVPRESEKGIPTTDPKVEGIKKTLIDAGKIIADDKGLTVKQNSGYPSQLFKDLEQISDTDTALNEYLNIKDDAGEFKKTFGDWENQIMKDYGRAGNEYTVLKPTKEGSSYVTAKDDKGKLVLQFNESKVRREEDFSKVKQEYAAEDKEQSPEYRQLYDKTINKLRDLKLHLIHQELIRKQKGEVTTEDNIRSLKEIERINNIDLAKDYYGEPMIFMHSGNAGIKKFLKPGDEGYKRNDALTGSAGLYFSRDTDQAERYAGFKDRKPAEGKDVYYSFLRTKNPYYITDPRAQAEYPLTDSKTLTNKDVEALKKLGYDSIIWDKEGAPKHEMVVFEPDQVKIIGSHREGLRGGETDTPPSTPKPPTPPSGDSVDTTPKDVHAAAKSAGVDFESKEFMAKSKELTGHEHLDDMTPAQLQQMVEYVSPKKPYAIAKRILESDADDAIKRGVKQKGAEYVPKGIDITDREAKDLLDLYGPDKAETLIRDTKNGLTGDTRTALAARIYESYKQAGDQATDPETKQVNYDKAVDIALVSAEQLKEAGRQANAAKIWKSITSSEDMTVLAIEKENQRHGQRALSTIYKQVKRSRQQFDEEIQRVISKRVTEGVEQQLKRAKLITADQRKKISSTFDSLKVKDVGGAANDITRVLGATVWNGSIEAVKRAVLAGADLANAIQAGVQYIRDNHKGDWDEAQYTSAISPAVEQMIPKDKVESSEINQQQINTPKLSDKKKKEFIDQVVEAHNQGKLTDDRFDQLYAKQLGAREFTPEDRVKIRQLAKTISEVEEFEEKVKNDFTKENIAKYKDLLARAQKANSDLQQYAQKPNNIWDTLISIMQGNLLTPLSLVTNIYSNTALQPLRFFSTGVGSIIDYSVSQLAKTGMLNSLYKDKTIDLVELQKGYFQGGWNGILEGGKQIVTGPKGDERSLREINNQFSPVRAIARWADGNRTASQKANDYVEGTLGIPAEVMFRLLNAGDKPFRRAAETARAMEIASQKKLKGKDMEKFIMFPDLESAELIQKAGDDATFQQESESTKLVQKILSWLIEGIGKTPIIGGPLKVIAKSQIPYVKTPWNIMVETLKYAAFPITGAVGIHQLAKGNKRAGSVLLGQAIVGAMIFAVAKELFSKGLLSWDEPYDQKAGKQRERRQIQYDNIPPNALNVSAIQRGLLPGGDWEIKDDDRWIDYNKLGVVGLLFDNYSNNYFSNIKEEGQMPDESDLWVDMLTTAPRVLSQSLDQSFLKGTNTFLTALQDGGGYESEQWLINTSGALAAIAYPNTLSTISKSEDEFIRDTRDDSFVQRLQNTYKTKFFIGDQLPPKVNLWGEKITGNPEGRNKYAYYLFDPTKFKNVDTDNFKYKLYTSWKESKFDDDYLPSIPKREITYRKVKIKLDAQQYERLATAIGEQRKNLASTYINSAGFDRKDKEKVIKKLKDLYEEGASRGKKKFLRDSGWNVLTPDALGKIGKK